MATTPQRVNRTWWAVCALLSLGVVSGGGYFLFRGDGITQANAQEHGPQAPAPSTGIRVDVARPRKTNMDRTTGSLPCTVQSFEYAQLYAEVSGYLKTQTVDIGDRVKRGQVLATIDVPELQKQVQRNKAGMAQANAHVRQMDARVATAKADREAAQAAVVHAEANAKSAEAWRRLREKQWGRMKDLFALKSIDERLVDEAQEHFEAAMETVRSAHAAIALARAKLAAAEANIQQAEADVLEAQAQVEVAQADLEKSQVVVQFATITSPYDGIITQRSQLPGDFVRAATGGTAHVPLLTVERTDKMRVVVQIPDRDVPYADPGDAALVEVDALPGKKFDAKISRIAGSEDPQTRLMRVEIDLPNPTGKIRQGMYGRATVVLEKSADVLTIPLSCLVSRTADGKGVVFVVRDGCARRISVQLGGDNGIRVAILHGLQATDQVLRHPPSDLTDGTAVSIGSSDALPKGRTGG